MTKPEVSGRGEGLETRGRGRLRRLASRYLRETSGATAIEYGLIVGFIFLAVVTAIHYLAGKTGEMYNLIGRSIASAS